MDFAKETLRKLEIRPAVHDALEEITCFKSESVFSAAEFKCAFQKLQFCHWFYFAHKIIILTPFLSILISLDSYLHALHVRNISLLF